MGLGYINFYATVEIHIKRYAIELDWGKSGVGSAVLLSFRAEEKNNTNTQRHLTMKQKFLNCNNYLCLNVKIFHIVCSIDKIVDYYNLLAFSLNT